MGIILGSVGLASYRVRFGLCILDRENILEQNGQGFLALLSLWLLLKVLEVKFLKIPKVVGA
jgi:predicted transcriptional regulator